MLALVHVALVALAAATVLSYGAGRARIYGGVGRMLRWRSRAANVLDGFATAKNAFGVSIKLDYCAVCTPAEFDLMNVGNHRAVLGQTPADTFPPHDRPRGSADLSAVDYFTHTEDPVDPVMLLNVDGLHVLDGVHRLVAAYHINSPIRYCVYVPATVSLR